MFADSNLTWRRCVAMTWIQQLLTVFENPVTCLQRALGSQMKETPGALHDLFPENGCI